MIAGATDGWTLLAIAGLTVITVVTRSFFFISSRAWKLPRWAERGLQYAPIAALAAVVMPEVFTVQGQLVRTLADARIWGAAAGLAVYYWRRDVFHTILLGMAVYLPLHLGLGW
jgi:branched-subunit amino acid transport protein